MNKQVTSLLTVAALSLVFVGCGQKPAETPTKTMPTPAAPSTTSPDQMPSTTMPSTEKPAAGGATSPQPKMPPAPADGAKP